MSLGLRLLAKGMSRTLTAATLTVTEDSDEDYSDVISSMMTRFGSPFLCVVLMEWNT